MVLPNGGIMGMDDTVLLLRFAALVADADEDDVTGWGIG